jgi:hypothetical protein
MAVTINAAGTYLVTRLSDAESLTGWSAVTLEGSGGGPSAESSVGTIDLVREGANAVASIANKQRVALRFSFTSRNLTGENVYLWGVFLAAGTALLKANGGMQIELSSGSNRSYHNIAGSDTYSGGFVKWAVDTAKTPFENSGTAANIAAITEIGFICDVGGATTRFDNIVVDAIDVGTGLTFQGTTTTNKLLLEAATVDEATAIGVLSIINGIIFAQGSLEFSGTAQTSINETMVFTDTLLGAFTYQCDITGTVVFTNSSISAAGVVNYNFDASGATSFNMTGGSLSNCNQLTVASGQTLDGVVLSNITASLMTSATATGCTWVGSGLVTQGGATIAGCNFDNSVTASSLLADAINIVTKNTFNSDGSNHAVEISGAAADFTWDNSLVGYETGVAGTNVTTTATGNEAIWIRATTGTVTISVSGTATTPSVRSDGAQIDVVAGAIINVTDLVTGTRVRVTQSDGVTQLFNGSESGGAVSFSTSYAGAFNINARKASSAPFYQEWIGGGISTIGSTTIVKALQLLD